jgi:hypothetical protein
MSTGKSSKKQNYERNEMFRVEENLCLRWEIFVPAHELRWSGEPEDISERRGG